MTDFIVRQTTSAQALREHLMQNQSMNHYTQFLETKIQSAPSVGFAVAPNQLNPQLFDWQREIVSWALSKGRAALFEDCGLGKTGQQLEWAKWVALETGKPVLILAPLAVAAQTLREAQKFGVLDELPVVVCASQDDVPSSPSICITNYEKLARFEAPAFGGVVLDESSILKAFDGKTRNQIIEMFAQTPYKLACTATPSPNDHMELGNHAEFLGAMSRTEMLAQFFVHDGGETAKWRLKGHAEETFWQWVCSWAVMLRRPSDIGFNDAGFSVPPMSIVEHTVAGFEAQEGRLFAVAAQTLTERREARRNSLDERAMAAAAQIAQWDEQVLVFCDFNAEGDLLEQLIPGSVQVAGADKDEHKESAMMGFAEGEVKVLISKPSICGFGMNFQKCSKIVFVGLSDSFEQFYQAVRRCWRFGQQKPVEVHVFISEAEGNVAENIKRKSADAEKMADAMTSHLRAVGLQGGGLKRDVAPYRREVVEGEGWSAHRGDCVEIVSEFDDNSIAYSIFSPPFASLYTYSNSERDMGNCRDDGEFFSQFGFLVEQLYRVLKPGRLLSFHCMNLPTSKERDGVIGIRDFRGDLIRLFQSAGFIYHSEVCIWKDPVTAMQRTKALGLLHKTIRKDSSMSRQGIADYLVTMRKPGQNAEPIAHTSEEFPVDLWQRYASPVWMDINPSRTLQRESAREEKDERHICPLQLDVIERAMMLWSNPGDLVLSPFMGIGSECYVAVEQGRRAVGCELKESYFKQAVLNLRNASISASQQSLFDELELVA